MTRTRTVGTPGGEARKEDISCTELLGCRFFLRSWFVVSSLAPRTALM